MNPMARLGGGAGVASSSAIESARSAVLRSCAETLRSSACTLVANSLLDANDGAPLVRGVWPRRCGYAIFSTNSRPQAWAYFLCVASDGECLPVASKRSNRAMEGG